MANILNLDDYRRPRKAREPSAKVDPVPHYYCQRCDTDHFKLFASGEVHCSHCGALMRNIHVTTAPSTRGAGH